MKRREMSPATQEVVRLLESIGRVSNEAKQRNHKGVSDGLTVPRMVIQIPPSVGHPLVLLSALSTGQPVTRLTTGRSAGKLRWELA